VDEANVVLAEVCTSFLLLPSFESRLVHFSDAFLLQDVSEYPFFSYAASYWPRHLKMCSKNTAEALLQKAIRLCRARSDTCDNWLEIHLHQQKIDIDILNLGSDLQVAAIVGSTTLVEEYLHGISDSRHILEAIQYAQYAGQMEIVDLLLHRDPDLASRTSSGMSYLSCAINHGDCALVQTLLNMGADPNQPVYGRNALLHAAACGFPKVVELLLDHGARIDEISRYDGVSALSFAAQASFLRTPEYPNPQAAQRRNYPEVVRLLLERGADLQSRDSYEATALYHAIINRQLDIAVMLLDHGGANQTSFVNREGSALHAAATSGMTEIVPRLLAHINAPDLLGRFPLALAAGNGHRDMVELLIHNGADVNSIDSSGWTPLVHAAYYNRANVVRLLLDTSADRNMEEYSVQKVLPLLVSQRFESVVKMLKERTVENVRAAAEDSLLQDSKTVFHSH
jgi:ankyrin repeat protein